MVHSKIIATGAILLPNVGGFLTGIVVRRNMPWYNSLKKPDWTPPACVFAPVWTALYSSMGYASYVAWNSGGGFHGPAQLPLLAYGGHLALNWLWTPLFFSAHLMKPSLYELYAIDITAVITAYLFYQVKPVCGWLFLPYFAWLGYATAITHFVVKNNPQQQETNKSSGAKTIEIKDE